MVLDYHEIIIPLTSEEEEEFNSLTARQQAGEHLPLYEEVRCEALSARHEYPLQLDEFRLMGELVYFGEFGRMEEKRDARNIHNKIANYERAKGFFQANETRRSFAQQELEREEELHKKQVAEAKIQYARDYLHIVIEQLTRVHSRIREHIQKDLPDLGKEFTAPRKGRPRPPAKLAAPVEDVRQLLDKAGMGTTYIGPGQWAAAFRALYVKGILVGNVPSVYKWARSQGYDAFSKSSMKTPWNGDGWDEAGQFKNHDEQAVFKKVSSLADKLLNNSKK